MIDVLLGIILENPDSDML